MPTQFTKGASSGGASLRTWLFATAAVFAAISCSGGARAHDAGVDILGSSAAGIVSGDQQPVPEPGALFGLAIGVVVAFIAIKQRERRLAS
jgi:hypothetical protein